MSRIPCCGWNNGLTLKIMEIFYKLYVKHERAFFLLTVFLLFILRLVCVYAFGQFDLSTFEDGKQYNSYANEIVSGFNWITNSNFSGSFREPVYPLFIAGIYLVAGPNSFLVVYIIQAIISSITLWLVYRTAMLCFNSKPVAYISLIWSGLYVFYLKIVGQLIRETLICFLMSLFVYLFIKYLLERRASFRRLLILAAVFTLLIHTDGIYLGYAPFLVIPFLIYWKPFWRSMKQYFLFGCLVLLISAPWVIRNYITYGDFVIVSYYTLNLSGSNKLPREELFNFREIHEVGPSLVVDDNGKVSFVDYNQNYPSQAERDSVKSGLNPRLRSNQELKAIRNDKYAATTYTGRTWYYFKKMWSPIDRGGYYAAFPMAWFEQGHSLRHNTISLLQYGLLIPFAIIGVICIFLKRHYMGFMLLFPILIHMFIHLFTFSIDRYRQPVVSFITILGVYGFVLSVEKLGLVITKR